MQRTALSTDLGAVDQCIAAYVHWYNSGKKVSTSGCYPEERYSGKRDNGWYARLVKALKLEHILPIPPTVELSLMMAPFTTVAQ
jgi:hypothetical protein